MASSRWSNRMHPYSPRQTACSSAAAVQTRSTPARQTRQPPASSRMSWLWRARSPRNHRTTPSVVWLQMQTSRPQMACSCSADRSLPSARPTRTRRPRPARRTQRADRPRRASRRAGSAARRPRAAVAARTAKGKASAGSAVGRTHRLRTDPAGCCQNLKLQRGDSVRERASEAERAKGQNASTTILQFFGKRNHARTARTRTAESSERHLQYTIDPVTTRSHCIRLYQLRKVKFSRANSPKK